MKEFVVDKAVLKNAGLMFVILCLLLLSLPAPAQTGGPYELSWSTIDGGGGTSSGGPYSVTGTIGQPDSDWSRGGDYEILGGFWAGGPLCIVSFDGYARFAEYWLETGTGLPADLYEDEHNIIDGLDLHVFADYWLSYCPANWPLK